MFIKPRFRLVKDGTRIQFMRGRFMGLIVSAVLSTASVVLFFYPGLNLGIDFSGGVVMEVRTDGPADFTQIRAALASEHVPEQGVQRFGEPSEVLIRLGAQPTEQATQQAVTRVRDALEKSVPGAKILRTDAVGASVSAELFRNGLLALVRRQQIQGIDLLFETGRGRGRQELRPLGFRHRREPARYDFRPHLLAFVQRQTLEHGLQLRDGPRPFRSGNARKIQGFDVRNNHVGGHFAFVISVVPFCEVRV